MVTGIPHGDGALSILVVQAHDARHPSVTGGDLHLQLVAAELGKRGCLVELWTCSCPGLPKEERLDGVQVRRFGEGPFFPVQVWGRLIAGSGRPFDLILEQVIGSSKLPYFGRILSPRRAVGFWYQDNRQLFRALFRGPRVFAADALQSFLLLGYARGHLITNSESSKAWLCSRGLPAERVGVSFPRINQPASRVRVPYAERMNRFVVIGNFRPTKRMEEAIDVLSELRKGVRDASLCLIGRPQDPAYLDHLRRTVRSRGLSSAVDFRVGVDDETKMSLLSRSKALTVHSPIEGFGWTVPEAGSVGVPAVVNPGVPSEVLQDGEGGTRVPFGDVKAYTRVLASWMSSEEMWRPRADAARAASERFLRPTVSDELYQQIIAWSVQRGR